MFYGFVLPIQVFY